MQLLQGLCEGVPVKTIGQLLVVTSDLDARAAIADRFGDEVVLRKVDFSDTLESGFRTCKMIRQVHGSAGLVVIYNADTPRDIWTVLGVALATGKPALVLYHIEMRDRLPKFVMEGLPRAAFSSYSELLSGILQRDPEAIPRTIPRDLRQASVEYLMVPKLAEWGDVDFLYAVGEGLATLRVDPVWVNTHRVLVNHH